MVAQTDWICREIPAQTEVAGTFLAREGNVIARSSASIKHQARVFISLLILSAYFIIYRCAEILGWLCSSTCRLVRLRPFSPRSFILHWPKFLLLMELVKQFCKRRGVSGKGSEVGLAVVLQTKCLICNLFAKKALMLYNKVALKLG